MALSKGSITLRFSGGIETKSDPKSVPTTRLLELENAVFTKAVSLSKRNGYEALSSAIDNSAAPLTGAIRLASRDDELLAFTADRCYSRGPTSEQWSDAGPVYSVVGSDRAVSRTGTQQTMPDHATLSGVSVLAWEDSRGGVWWTSVDATTGRVFRAPSQLDADGQRPRCVAVGSALHVYWANAVLGRVQVVVVNPALPSADVTSAILIDDLLKTNPVYDACPTTRDGMPALIAWAEHGATSVRIGLVDASGVLGSPTTGHPSVFRELDPIDAASPIAVAYLSDDGAGDELAATWVSGDYVTAFTYTDAIARVDMTGLFAETLVKRIALAYADDDTRTLWCAAEENATEPSNHYVTVCSVLANVAGSTRTIRSAALASRAFAVGGYAFATFVHDTTYFNTYLTLRLSDSTCVGRHLAGLAAAAPVRTHLGSAHVTGDAAAICLPYRERLESENNDKFHETGLRLVGLDFDSEDSHGGAQLGRGLYMAGACPQHYDGRNWTEQGFHVGPEVIGATPGTGGSSVTSSATYLYRAWYEWTDAQGEVHRGPTSIGTTVVTGASDTQVTLTLPTLRLTAKPGARICVARSRANDETELFRVTSLDTTASGPNGYVANDPTVDTVTFVDRMSDGNAAAQEPLYTNGGILSNDPTSLGSVVAGGKSRLFFSDPSDENVIRYSQELEAGYGVECPPELSIRCDPFGGAITGLAVMDELVVVFKEHAVFAFTGDGPNAAGLTTTQGFSAPQRVPGDYGCVDPNSIVVTPVGIMFASATGIVLIDRSLQTTYVGAPVETYNAQRVRRGTTLPGRTQIVFLTDSGKSLLYDYLFGQWSTFTNHEGLDAIVVADAYHYLRTDDRVFRETPGVYTDDGKRIRMRLETAWIHMVAHLQGWQRFYHMLVIGEAKSAHQLVVQYRTDYVGHWIDPAYLDATGAAAGATGWVTGPRAGTIGDEPLAGSVYGDGPYGDGPYGGTGPGLYQWRAHLGVVGQAVQFRFEDFEGDDVAGAGFELSELTLTGGVKGNARRPFSAARST